MIIGLQLWSIIIYYSKYFMKYESSTWSILQRLVVQDSSTQGWYMPRVTQLKKMTAILTLSNHVFIRQLSENIFLFLFLLIIITQCIWLISLYLTRVSLHISVMLLMLVLLLFYIFKVRSTQLVGWIWRSLLIRWPTYNEWSCHIEINLSIFLELQGEKNKRRRDVILHSYRATR